MDIGKSLKIELPRFANGSDLGCERMRGIKHYEMEGGREKGGKEDGGSGKRGGKSSAWKGC